MNKEQNNDMNDNAERFVKEYCPKYVNGVKNHLELVASTGEHFLIDEEDLSILEQWTWRVNKGAVCRNDWKTKKGVLLHRLIMDAPKGMEVDHINGDSLDNRRSNLRICTHQQNSMNLPIRKGKKTSKYKGVSYSDKHKWRMKITVNGIHTEICGFKTEDDTAREYNKYARKLHGEFARLNDVPEEGMTAEGEKDMLENVKSFSTSYSRKYKNGQVEHGGLMWEMGLKQVHRNAKEEVLDLWSYLCTLEKVIDEIEEVANSEVLDILHRVKED